MAHIVSRAPAAPRVLGAIGWVIAALGLIKFLGILIDAGAASAPWMFLLVLVLPFVVGALLLRDHPRAGAAVIGTFAALMATLYGIAVVQGIEPYWADWMMVLVG